MSGLLALGRLMRADFLERVRRHSFLVTLGFTVFAAYLFLPPNHSTYATLNLSGHRGIYNSAWVGSLVAMLSVTFLALAGFYLVKNAVERDRRTGVGQILAATPLPTPVYLLAKLASNFAVLASMVAVLVVTAAVMQLVRGEDTHIDLLALVGPFFTVTLPVMALVAALAVGFEAVPGLRGGLGNVVYFIFWMTTLSLSAAHPGRGTDILGSEVIITQMQQACVQAYPDYHPGEMAMGFNIKSHGVWDLETFVWQGAVWPPAALATRALYLLLALAVPLAAALVFDRFDARTAGPQKRAPKPASPRRRARAAAAEPPPAVAPVPRLRPVLADVAGLMQARAPAGRRSRLGGLIAAELRITLKGLSRWWLLVVLALTALSLFVPLAGVKQFVAPIALVWPVLRWSPMGTREREFRTDALLFSAPRPVTRLLVAQWVAGAALALLVSGGALIRFAAVGAAGNEWGSFAALIVAVGFIPSLALAFGIWSGSGKLFEVLYLILWYMGPMNRIPVLDFVGVTQPGSGAGPVVSFLVAGVLFAAFAVAGRRRQLAR
jgi:ABC-type multidrug transport system permease subunit